MTVISKPWYPQGQCPTSNIGESFCEHKANCRGEQIPSCQGMHISECHCTMNAHTMNAHTMNEYTLDAHTRMHIPKCTYNKCTYNDAAYRECTHDESAYHECTHHESTYPNVILNNNSSQHRYSGCLRKECG
ncbi:hypothetical protein M758_UG127400 [Ceratodon purpureus]|nr:hypothetical protein M758_UG127400 [Ceratodon purpureus]